MKNMALEIDDLRQSINRENQNIKKIRPEAFWPFRKRWNNCASLVFLSCAIFLYLGLVPIYRPNIATREKVDKSQINHQVLKRDNSLTRLTRDSVWVLWFN